MTVEQGETDLKIPRHVTIVMDGNGRWASARRLPRIEGHRRGIECAEDSRGTENRLFLPADDLEVEAEQFTGPREK